MSRSDIAFGLILYVMACVALILEDRPKSFIEQKEAKTIQEHSIIKRTVEMKRVKLSDRFKKKKEQVQEKYRTIISEVTAYTAGYESTGKTPDHPAYGITSSGKEVQSNHTIAADIDVLPYGTKVMIEGFGDTIFVVEDTGSAINGNDIDIYMSDLNKALKFGRQERRVTILKMGDE